MGACERECVHPVGGRDGGAAIDAKGSEVLRLKFECGRSRAEEIGAATCIGETTVSGYLGLDRAPLVEPAPRLSIEPENTAASRSDVSTANLLEIHLEGSEVMPVVLNARLGKAAPR